MTTTGPTWFETDDPEAIKKWERRLFVLAARETVLFNPAAGLIRDDEFGFIQRKNRIFDAEGGGARATFTLIHEFTGSPSYGNENLHGKEQGQRTATDTLDIDQIRIAAALDGRMVEQRVPWKAAELNQQLLARQFRTIMESGALMHATGFNIDATTDPAYAPEWWLKGNHKGHTFGHLPRTPDPKHFYRCGNHATDQAVAADSTAWVDLDTINTVCTRGKRLPIPIRKAKIGKGNYFVFLLHTDAVAMLRNSESEWWQLMTAQMQGGKIDGNPIMGSSEGMTPLGKYLDTIFFECIHLPPGIHSVNNTPVPNTRRWVFGGAQTLLFGLGKYTPNENQFKFKKQDWDYEDKRGIAALLLAGMRSPRFHVELVGEDHDYGRIAGTGYVEDTLTWS